MAFSSSRRGTCSTGFFLRYRDDRMGEGLTSFFLAALVSYFGGMRAALAIGLSSKLRRASWSLFRWNRFRRRSSQFDSFAMVLICNSAKLGVKQGRCLLTDFKLCCCL